MCLFTDNTTYARVLVSFLTQYRARFCPEINYGIFAEITEKKNICIEYKENEKLSLYVTTI